MLFKLDLEKYNFKEYKAFDVNLISIDPRVRDMCAQNLCGFYGRNHMCPPSIKEIDEWKKEIFNFNNAIMVTKVYQAESSYDIEAMIEGSKDFQKTLSGLREELSNEYSYSDFLLLGAGACLICEKCSILDDKPCRFPDKAFPSVEACGIDVMSLSKKAGVKYNNGKNTITYFAIIFYN
ncbi:MAG: DUF2284 domain-containing protein [Spirochaetes bacterium]|nr:DUF2284 domain-containing protein [Spirochaetota bacterium]